MIWIKTDAGRAEIQARAVVKERALRTLLLLIDGRTPDDKLLASVAGVQPQHFEELRGLGLIAPTEQKPASRTAQPSSRQTAAASVPAARGPSSGADAAVDIDVGGLGFEQLRGVIGKLISSQLGIRGFTLAMVLEEAMTMTDLRDVAQRVVGQIEQRKGAEAGREARRLIAGG